MAKLRRGLTMRKYKTKKFHICCTFLGLYTLMAAFSCQKAPQLPDLNTISWIQKHGYQSEEVFPITTTGKIPGPQIEVSIGNKSENILLDLSSFGLILKENAFKNLDFEPQRMASSIIGNTEMLLEEGFINNISILGVTYPVIYSSILKHTNNPFKSKGIIGRIFFLNSRMTLDINNKILAFTTQTKQAISEIVSSSEIIPIDLSNQSGPKNGLIKFHGSINGKQTMMTITTRSKKSQISPELAGSLSEKPTGNYFQIDTLKIGNKIFTDLKCDIKDDQLQMEPESAEPLHFSLGLDIISKIILTIDFVDEIMVIE